jgi:hypothetical protein
LCIGDRANGEKHRGPIGIENIITSIFYLLYLNRRTTLQDFSSFSCCHLIKLFHIPCTSCTHPTEDPNMFRFSDLQLRDHLLHYDTTFSNKIEHETARKWRDLSSHSFPSRLTPFFKNFVMLQVKFRTWRNPPSCSARMWIVTVSWRLKAFSQLLIFCLTRFIWVTLLTNSEAS